MSKSFFGGVVVSLEADTVARELILELQIPKLYNLAFLLIGILIFSKGDPDIWQNFLLYLKNPQFMGVVLVMILLIAIPLYLLTYWFYGKQAQRMADKMFNVQ